jgi:outer membrane protein OmpA-like peptidoglycan-associated protein
MRSRRYLALAAVTAALACISSAIIAPIDANAMPLSASRKQTLDFSGMQPNAEDIVRALRPASGPRTRSLSMRALPYARSQPEDASPSGGNAPSGTSASVSFDQIEFNFNSAAIRPTAYRTLDEIGRALNSKELSGLNFIIEGHTDVRGNFAYNIKLSRRRAHEVGTYLMARHGIAADRIAFVGKGPTELIDPERPESASNRRVVLAVQAPKSAG